MEQQSCDALVEMRDVLLETYAVNDAMNQLLLAHLDPRLASAVARDKAQRWPDHCRNRGPPAQ